jgi:hypothetical protein
MSNYPPFDPVDYILENYKKSINNTDITIKFRTLYSSFNAWLNLETSKLNELDKVLWFCNNNKAKEYFENELKKNDRFSKMIKELLHINVLDGREKSRDPILLKDINDFCTIMKIVYRVRSNLVHGRKNPKYKWDKKLIEICYVVLTTTFVPIVEDIIKLQGE